MTISLTVIIPTLNEGESIGPTIDQIPRDLPWLDVKVLIVDGNSTDNTAEEAKKEELLFIMNLEKDTEEHTKLGLV